MTPSLSLAETRWLCLTVAVLFVVLFMPALALAATPAPDVVYARATDGDTIYVNWQPIDAVGSVVYRVDRSPDGATYSQVATVTGQFNFSHVDTGLSSSTNYWYRVYAQDDRGAGSPSAAVTTRTLGPERPTGLAVHNTSTGAVVSWQAPSNPAVAGYYVYRSDVSLGELTTLTVTPWSSVSYIDIGLTDGQPYWYRVAAVDASGAVGALSAEIRAFPKSLGVAALSPHGTVAAPLDECAACHRGHVGIAPNLGIFAEPTPTVPASPAAGPARATAASQEVCLTCHTGNVGSNVRTSIESTNNVSLHVITENSAEAPLYCGHCHQSHRGKDATQPALLDVEGVTSGNGVCLGCHGADSTLESGDFSAVEQSAHANETSNSVVGLACASCHDVHASPNPKLLLYDQWMSCMQCHGERGEGGSPDLFSIMSVTDDDSTRHDMTAGDQAASGARLTCQNCHSSHVATQLNPLIDPEDPSNTTASKWTGDVSSFCVVCHDGTLPSSDMTEPWVLPPLAAGGATQTVDIKSAFTVNFHGSATTTDGPLFLNSTSGYMAGDSVPCDACHGSHGSVNPSNLRQDVRGFGGTSTTNRALVAPVPGGGYDLRFFCTSCHDLTPANHLTATSTVDISAFPTDCTTAGCHRHTMQPAGSTTPTETGTSF